MDPDTYELSDYMVISRAGKATGINQYWLNVKNLQNGIMKSVDFEQTTKWTKIQEEVLFSADNSPKILKAQLDELDRWHEYKVYDKVDDLGQEAISTQWVFTEKVRISQKPIIWFPEAYKLLTMLWKTETNLPPTRDSYLTRY